MEWVFVVIIGLIIFAPSKDESTETAVVLCIASQCTLQTSAVKEDQVLTNSTSDFTMDTESKSQED